MIKINEFLTEVEKGNKVHLEAVDGRDTTGYFVGVKKPDEIVLAFRYREGILGRKHAHMSGKRTYHLSDFVSYEIIE